MLIDPEGYKYDVFISYLHTNLNAEEGVTSTWVRNFFHRELNRWLPEFVTNGRHRIFLDETKISIGMEWPSTLREALQTTRCLLPVLSNQYFDSAWCNAELKSMIARQKSLLSTSKLAYRLIYPVIFSGAKEAFPPEVQTIQMRDLRKFAFTYSAFKDSSEYGSFEKEIKSICEDLSTMIREAPPWQNWQVDIPELEQTPPSPTVLRPQM